MIEIRTATVTLGEKEYTIREASHLRAGPWAKRLIAEVKPLFAQVSQAQDIRFENAADLLQLWPMIEGVFTEALDKIYDLLLAYSSVLEADAAYIGDNATQRQVLAAFQEVVSLADPFGLVPTLTSQLGRAAIGTSSSLPPPNGAVRSKKRTR